MKASRHFFGALAALMLITCLAVSAASPHIEGTPLPPAPKPDFSAMQWLMGTWNCTNVSSRRPGPFTTTEVNSMDPTGYWMLRDITTHKASWIPRESHGQMRVTYDPLAKHWVRIVTDDQGGYTVATAPASTGNTRTFTYVIRSKSPDIASYAPEVFTKESDTKRTMTTSFTETAGRVVNVKQDCTKQ